MMSRLGYLSMSLIVVAFGGLGAGCSSSSDDSPAPGQNNPEAGAPDGQAEASPDASPEASAEASAEASPDGDTTDSPVESGPEAGTEQKACLDIHVGPELLGDPARWEADPVMPSRGSSWPTRVVSFDSKLYVVWIAKEKVAPAQGTASRRVIISSFDPQTGGNLKNTVLSPVPTGQDKFFTQKLATDNNGNYALLLTWDNSQQGQRLVLGKLDGSVEVVADDLADSTVPYGYSSVAWDGEAFVLHGSRTLAIDDIAILMRRVGLDGSVLTPVTELALTRIEGAFPSTTPFFESFVQPGNGRFLLQRFNVDYNRFWTAEHERDGALIPGLGSPQWKPMDSAEIITAGQDRFLARTRTSDWGFVVQSLGEQLGVEQSLTISGDPSPDPSNPSRVWVQNALEWQGKWHWILGHHASVEVQSWQPGQPVESVHLLDYVRTSEPCLQSPSDCRRDSIYSNSEAELVPHDGSLWVGIWDQQSQGTADQAHPFYRVLRVNSSCNYQINQTVVYDQ